MLGSVTLDLDPVDRGRSTVGGKGPLARVAQGDAYWKTRSRISWLKEGYRNTSYFHHKASQSKKQNTIEALTNDLGVQIEDDIELEDLAVNYFTQIFMSQAQFSFMDEVLIKRTLMEVDILSLSIPFSRDEVLYALKHIHP
ncbi:hypothetical protein M9H77_17374 [Catharanthus roseus]|uniref:Uncharacterized protein n=1 Tax=Catharanthus roseus TaxID=4058 RepID=A0ACC0B4G0_CATRO|nr:hypothetical protein M9H77_17374 [Catharanthus roseus]